MTNLKRLKAKDQDTGWPLWRFRKQREGRYRVDATFPAPDRAAAEQYSEKLIQQSARETMFGERPSVTYGNAVQRYLDESASEKKESSHAKDRRIASLIFRLGGFGWLRDKDVSTLSSQDFFRLQQERAKEVSPQTVNREMAFHRMVLRRCNEQYTHDGVFDTNGTPLAYLPHAIKFPRLKEADKREPYVISDRELSLLLSCMSPAYAAAVRFAALTGARGGEVCALRWSMLKMVGPVSYFRLPQGLSKSGRDRYIVLSDEAWKTLPRAKVGEVFSVSRLSGAQWIRAREKAAARYREALGVDCPEAFHNGSEGVRPHDLRHTFATKLANAGVEWQTIQMALGHSIPGVTAVYAAPTLERLAEAVEKVVENREMTVLRMVK